MLKQWSKEILEAWIGVYAKLLPLYAENFTGPQQQEILNKGIETVQRLSTRTGPMQVRTCCAQLIGAFADSNSLKSTKLFEDNLVPIIKDICDDFNWEVRKEICG